MVARLSLKTVAPEQLFLDILPPATRRAFLYCTKLPFLAGSRWYLAGGTALALQVGHRQSVDLDFFTMRPKFGETDLELELLATKQWQTTLLRKGTVYGILEKAKMSFIAYPFFQPSIDRLACGTVRILLSQDIAAMKIIAISQRGRKRDFLDLYWYCHNREPLIEVVKRSLHQYPGQEHNLPHILKSLTYFVDAENEPLPKVFFKVSWREIKKYFEREAIGLAKELLT